MRRRGEIEGKGGEGRNNREGVEDEGRGKRWNKRGDRGELDEEGR